MPARFTRDLSPADVGARVVLRVVGADGGQREVLGTLESWDGDVLAVRRRDGTLVEAAEHDVVGAKRVPAPPPRRR